MKAQKPCRQLPARFFALHFLFFLLTAASFPPSFPSVSPDLPAFRLFTDADKLLVAAGLSNKLGIGALFHNAAVIHHQNLVCLLNGGQTVCAVAVPAFAAEEVEQENCLSSSYVQMNIPYADFYKAAGVDNASEIDAVILGAISSTTVTRKYTPYSVKPIILDILFFM